MIWYLVAGNGVKAIMNKGNETMKEKKREITQEEQKVLQHIAAGYTDHEIAEKMNIKYSAVRDYIRRLFFKTDTVNRPHLVSWAYREGLLKSQ